MLPRILSKKWQTEPQDLRKVIHICLYLFQSYPMQPQPALEVAGREVLGLPILIKTICNVSHGHLRRKDGLNLPSHLAIKKHNRGGDKPCKSGSHQLKHRIHCDNHPHCPISCCDLYRPPTGVGEKEEQRQQESLHPLSQRKNSIKMTMLCPLP